MQQSLMSIAEAVIEKLNALPPEKQEQVLHFAESLADGQAPAKTGNPYEWAKIAMSMNLVGPPDMSAHLDDYLYGEKKNAQCFPSRRGKLSQSNL
jgi:hypothetical protein